jgi:hypothetical protein
VYCITIAGSVGYLAGSTVAFASPPFLTIAQVLRCQRETALCFFTKKREDQLASEEIVRSPSWPSSEKR